MNIEQMKNKFKEYKTEVITFSIFSLLLYSFFMTQQLTNDIDGFWKQNYYLGGEWEVGCGRWLWPYIDKIQFGIHIDPLTTIGTLFILMVGYILILDMFDIKNRRAGILGGLIFLSSPVILVFLSYRFQAVVFAVPFLLAVLSVFCLAKIRNRYCSAAVSAIFTCLSMSVYQTHLAAIGVLGLAFIIYMCLDDEDISKIIEFFLKLVISIVCGGLLYYISLNVYLKITGMTLSEYDGVADISILSIIKNLPAGIANTYRTFFVFFKGEWFKYNAFSKSSFFIVFSIVIGIMCLWILVCIFRKSIVKGLISLVGLLVMPIAANATLLLAEEAGYVPQMCSSLVLAVVMVMLLSEYAYSLNKFKVEIITKTIPVVFALIAIFFVYGNSVQNVLDQNAMYEGKNATVAMMTQVVDDLEDAGAISDTHQIFFIGKPSANKYFKVSPLYEQANGYARVGDFGLSGSGMYGFYQALLNKLLYIDAQVLCENYENLAYEEYYQAMPSYPEAGYFVVWDTVIVKISEP